MSRRIVILTEIISPYRIPVFNALAARDEIDLHVIFLAETDPTQRQWLVYKSEIRFSYEVLPSWRSRLGGKLLLLNRGVVKALERARPEAIVCGGYNYLASWQCLGWARRRRVPFLLWVESTVRDRRAGNVLVESLKKRFLRNCTAFVAAGKSSAEYLGSYGLPADLICTAPNAVDNGLFAQRAGSARQNAPTLRQTLGLPARFFLSVGRLLPEKGVFDLIQAYALLDPGIRSQVGLVFVGDGVARPELERQAAALNPGTVQIAGFVQRDDLPGYYALADAFIFPTYTDPWGLVVNEAMACGLPVIASDVAGCVADLVEDGWNGFVLPPRETATLSHAMETLARDPELSRRMASHSLERIQPYSPEAWAAGMARAVGAVCAKAAA